MKNKKGFTLVELLAVIVVLAIVMGIAAVAITNVLDSTRKNAYVASAKQYIEGAKSLVEAEVVDRMFATGEETTYLKECAKDNTYDITIADIKLKSGGDSPYGAAFDTTKSKVVVKVTDSNCSTFEYSIYMEDKLGNKIAADSTGTTPVAASALDATKVITAS